MRGDAGQFGAQAHVLGLGLGQREGRRRGLILVPLRLQPVAQGPVVEAQFPGGALDVPAVALAVRDGRLLEGRVVVPAHAFGGAVGCGGRCGCFVHGAVAAHATQHGPTNRYRLKPWAECRNPVGVNRFGHSGRNPTPGPPLRAEARRAGGVEEVAAAPSLHRRLRRLRQAQPPV